MQNRLLPPLLGLALSVPAGAVVADDLTTGGFGRFFQPLDMTQRGEHFYIGSRLRISDFDDTSLGYQVPGSQPDEAVSTYDVGFGSAFTLGYASGPIMGTVGGRVEAEVGTFSSDVSEISVGGAVRGEADSIGSIDGFTGYVSGYADAHFGRFMPFVGVGIGIASLELSDQGSFTDGLVIDDTTQTAAAHLSAGLGIALTERSTIEIGYRHEFFNAAEFTTSDGTVTSTDIERRSLTLGFRRAF